MPSTQLNAPEVAAAEVVKADEQPIKKVVESQEAGDVAPVDDVAKELKEQAVVEPVVAKEGQEVEDNVEDSAEEDEEEENGEEQEVGEENVVEYKRKSCGDEEPVAVEVSPKKLKTGEEATETPEVAEVAEEEEQQQPAQEVVEPASAE